MADQRREKKFNVLFDTIRNRELSDDVCFLCGSALDSKNRSDEHVIPKWIQKRYDLWNQHLTLLNGSKIPYRKLTIPCCSICNNDSLQPIETVMARAVESGPNDLRKLDPHIIFIWLGKIFYGLLHKELFLLFNRKISSEGNITTPELIHDFSLHHYFLQSIRVNMHFKNSFPASIFIFETKAPLESKYGWDFRDILETIFISVRMGNIGIIGVLQDGGAHEFMKDNLKEYFNIPLHPIQFLEISAGIGNQSFLLNRKPKYIISETEPIEVIQLPLGGLSSKPIFDDWNPKSYAKVLSMFTHIEFNQLFQPPDKIFTFLKNSDGSFNDIDLNKVPWPLPRNLRLQST